MKLFPDNKWVNFGVGMVAVGLGLWEVFVDKNWIWGGILIAAGGLNLLIFVTKGGDEKGEDNRSD